VFYMADSNGAFIRRLDLKTHQATVLKTLSKFCLREGEQPYLLVDGDKLYISCYWASGIYVYDLKTGQQTQKFLFRSVISLCLTWNHR
jgi:hypothetical protein